MRQANNVQLKEPLQRLDNKKQIIKFTVNSIILQEYKKEEAKLLLILKQQQQNIKEQINSNLKQIVFLQNYLKAIRNSQVYFQYGLQRRYIFRQSILENGAYKFFEVLEQYIKIYLNTRFFNMEKRGHIQKKKRWYQQSGNLMYQTTSQETLNQNPYI
ncbi:unnamed protein product [Paramecium sonneborni]|uniref:Uncharacterized protein n=1 Tax=Paramecium sonneborni TaxID=65129 RepID=A0A8S1KUW8_9CILI|nr:unnamed protein product [Paramecium sonneborni]